MVGWAQTAMRDQSTNTWEDAEAVLAQDQRALDLIEEVIARPALDFQLDYRKGFGLLLPHLSQLRQTAVRLSQAAVCDLHHGRSDLATRKVQVMLATVTGIADERLVISQLVRMAIAQVAVTATWELLQSPNCNEEQLAVIQDDWTGLDFSPAVENALLMERAMTEATMEKDATRAHLQEWPPVGRLARQPPRKLVRQAAEFSVLNEKTVGITVGTPSTQVLEGRQAIIEAANSERQTVQKCFREKMKRLKS